jgi:hypothetical protein
VDGREHQNEHATILTYKCLRREEQKNLEKFSVFKGKNFFNFFAPSIYVGLDTFGE